MSLRVSWVVLPLWDRLGWSQLTQWGLLKYLWLADRSAEGCLALDGLPHGSYSSIAVI